MIFHAVEGEEEVRRRGCRTQATEHQKCLEKNRQQRHVIKTLKSLVGHWEKACNALKAHMRKEVQIIISPGMIYV